MNNKNRIEIVDGLRGFAILIVAWYHIWQQSWLWTDFNLLGHRVSLSFIPRVGFFGVEIFFVISGFCIFYPFARCRLENRPVPAWKDFYKRRLVRIIPSYYLLLAIAVPLTRDFPSNINKLWYLARHLLCINSLFPETFNSLYNGVLWSLSVEVQFYIVFPLLCRLMRRNPVFTFVSVCLFANLYRLFVLTAYPFRFSFLFNQLPGTVDLFVGGMLAAYICAYVRDRYEECRPVWLAPIGTAMSVFAFAALLGLFKSEPVLVPFYMPSGALPIQVWQAHVRWIVIILVMLIILGGGVSYRVWIRIFSNKLMVFLSAISYNLYLWHSYIALALKYRLKIPRYELVDGLLPNMAGNFEWQLSYTLLAAALSIIVAAVVTFTFERPFARLSGGFLRSRVYKMRHTENAADEPISG